MKPSPGLGPAAEAVRTVIYKNGVPTSERGQPTTNEAGDWSLGTPSSRDGNLGVHDASLDLNGNIWIANSAPSFNSTLFKIATKPGKTTGFPLPSCSVERQTIQEEQARNANCQSEPVRFMAATILSHRVAWRQN